MGVYIKGMEMPTSCDKCWALDDYGDYPRCRITEEQRGYKFRIREKRMDNCPLVPIPKHGRLIDADALLAAFEEDISKQDKYMELLESIGDMKSYFNISKLQIGMTSCRRLLDDAPTIIEAEDEE